MRARLPIAALFIPATCMAQSDGGGKDIAVALFSAQPASHVTVTATAPGAWWAACDTCVHQAFRSALHVPLVHEVIAGGAIQVRDEEHAQLRAADGLWHIRARKDGFVDVVLTMPSERYVAAVVKGEADAGEPPQSMRALAVVARTFALQAHARVVAGPLPSDICDSTACQAMKLGPVSSAVFEAVRSTAGETLWFRGRRAQVFFSGSCGGTTERGTALSAKLSTATYLRVVSDPFCVHKDHAAWHAEVSLTDVASAAAAERWHLPQRVTRVAVAERTPSQRARSVEFQGDDGRAVRVSAERLRLTVGRSLGWNLIRSDAYDVRLRSSLVVFDGHGHGHGVGLCQQGAAEMAREGKPYREILNFYFPGTTVGITPKDFGWMTRAAGGVSIALASEPTPALLHDVSEAWSIAQDRFPVRRDLSPVVVITPSTELFRQRTLQPGWQLASTTGTTITVQPLSVLARNRATLAAVLLHEMLHVAVESQANAKTPLWLREGLVEVLAGDASRERTLPSSARTEALLQYASTLEESRAAHRDAAARVRMLVDRYGISAVRGWVISGASVPSL